MPEPIAIDKGVVREYVIDENSIARLIRLGNKAVLCIDVIGEWKFDVEEELVLDNIRLIYSRGVIRGFPMEFVGYDDGFRRELIAVRIFFDQVPDDNVVKELIAEVLTKHAR